VGRQAGTQKCLGRAPPGSVKRSLMGKSAPRLLKHYYGRLKGQKRIEEARCLPKTYGKMRMQTFIIVNIYIYIYFTKVFKSRMSQNFIISRLVGISKKETMK
jgi:hypothetical protein